MKRIEPVKQASMTVRVGAEVPLRELDAHLARHGLSLGPLTPGALDLTVGAFLEGPYAGLRAVRGGRLEPLCGGLRAELADGGCFETSDAPRSAAGPELSALVLGGHGRLARVTHATLRCEACTASQLTRETHVFERADALVAAIQGALADGVLLWRVDVEALRARFWLRSGERLGLSGQASDLQVEPSLAPAERECAWADVEAALASGAALSLHRLSLATVVAQGAVSGLALGAPSPWHPVARLLEGEVHE